MVETLRGCPGADWGQERPGEGGNNRENVEYEGKGVPGLEGDLDRLETDGGSTWTKETDRGSI